MSNRMVRDYSDYVIADQNPQRSLQIIYFCCHVVPFLSPEWATDTNAFELSVLSGGITNELYKLRHTPSDTSVVVRVFGKETSRIISRDSELFYQSLFLPTYGKGSNVLVYKFLDGYRPLDFTELPKFGDQIAAALASFHVTATKASIDDRLDEEGSKTTTRFQREVNHTEFSLREWVDASLEPETVEKIIAKTAGKGSAASASIFHLPAREDSELLLQKLRPADEEQQQGCTRGRRLLPIGVCHNDLLAGNVMVRSRSFPQTSSSVGRCEGESNVVAPDDVQLIDFEYARKNYLLFDLANHLNEYAGVECNYHLTFPSDAAIADFVRAYRQHMRAVLLQEEAKVGATGLAEKLFGPAGADFFPREDASEDELTRRWVDEVKFFSVCSNLGWAAWSLLQQAHSVIDFDFFAYGKARYDRHCETMEWALHSS